MIFTVNGYQTYKKGYVVGCKKICKMLGFVIFYTLYSIDKKILKELDEDCILKRYMSDKDKEELYYCAPYQISDGLHDVEMTN